MIQRGLPLFRVAGVEIRMSAAWLVLGPMLVGAVAVVELPVRQPDWSDGFRWLVAILALGGFLGSTILHELAHLGVTVALGAPRRDVVVHVFGAPAPLDGGARSPRDEVRVAMAGPAASVVIAAVLLAGAALLPAGGVPVEAAREILLVVGFLSLVVAVTALVPIPPLDGARVLRAIALARTGDPARADRSVATAGRFVGLALMGGGLAIVVAGDPLTGILLVVLGFSVRGSMGGLARRHELDELVAAATVADAMDRELPVLPPLVTLDTFADRLEGPADETVLPVMDGDRLLGVVGLGDLRRAGRAKWSTVRAAEAMIPADRLPVVAPGDSLAAAVEVLGRSRLDGLPVMEDGRFVGLLTRYGVGRTLQGRIAARRPGAAAGSRPAAPGGADEHPGGDR